MAAPKFSPDTCEAIAELVFDGLSISDAARAAGVNVKTVKNWLTKGRREGDGPYSDFADAIERAREQSAECEQPMDEDELKLVVSRAAKKGSVAAQKLYWEMLRSKKGAADEKPANPFEELDGDDELAKARRRKAS